MQKSQLQEYLSFLDKKRHLANDSGIKVNWMPDSMFDYQQHAAEYSIKKGRCADYLDTGLGKTLIEIVTATNYIRATNKRTLILTPLAVAFQFIKEAEKFGVDDVSYSRDGKLKTKIVVTNYERLQHFDPNDFDTVICDESSALKNFEGATNNAVNAFVKKIKYRFLFTATPSPNDFVELGTSSEILGHLGYTDMLSRFFTNEEDTIKPQNIGVKWRLKGHAQKAFFEWVSSWSISMRKPSDLGFSDERHILPELITNFHDVQNKKPLVVNGQYEMFNRVARTNSEIQAEQRATYVERCEKAVELAANYDTTVYWCNRDVESDLLRKLDKGAVELRGKMDIDKKEEILLAFLNGDIKKLITKPTITGFGLNWQHCAHTVFFPTFSYEQYYQAIRRFWRFGQTRPVTVDLVYSDGQTRVLDALLAKAEKADQLFSSLNSNINRDYKVHTTGFDQQITLPSFL